MLPEGVFVSPRNEVGRNLLAVRSDDPAPIDRYPAKRGSLDDLVNGDEGRRRGQAKGAGEGQRQARDGVTFVLSPVQSTFRSTR